MELKKFLIYYNIFIGMNIIKIRIELFYIEMFNKLKQSDEIKI